MRGVGRRPAQRCRDTFGFPGQRYRRVGGTRQFLVGGEHVVEDLAQCMGSRIGGTGACAAGAISPICRSEALEDPFDIAYHLVDHAGQGVHAADLVGRFPGA